MDYVEALKKVQGRKTKENFFVFSFGYENKVVMPYKDGITLLASLQSAETFDESWSSKQSITAMSRDKVSVSTMSQEEYEQRKVAALLAVTYEDIQKISQTN